MTVAEIASRFINNTNNHIFLTGKAGTGKTTFLKNLINHTHKKAIIVAPTGIAAINAGGVTIHSQFQLPFGSFLPKNQPAGIHPEHKIHDPSTLLKNLMIRGAKRDVLQEIELLVIDEVSMLRADLLDAISVVLKVVRRSREPFGGVQILFIGDLLQLPPVVRDQEWKYLKDYYPSVYFFEAHALHTQPPIVIELDKIYRQDDQTFITLLNNLRDGKFTAEDAAILNKYYKPNAGVTDGYVYLTTHNSKADQINREKLASLHSKPYKFSASITGDFPEHSHPVPQEIELKEGAQIMFTKNDPTGNQRFFNGKIGTVASLSADQIKVKFEDGTELELEDYTWENKKYVVDPQTSEVEESTAGTYTQYPIKLAWAITVHKSQGLTFDKAVIDLEQAFAPGQVYVALSRLRSLNGLILTSPINQDSLQKDEVIAKFSSKRGAIEELKNRLKADSFNYSKGIIEKAFQLQPLNASFREHANSYGSDNRSVKFKHTKWAQNIANDVMELVKVAELFKVKLADLFDQFEESRPLIAERIKAAHDYFMPAFTRFRSRIIEHANSLEVEDMTKEYIDELGLLEDKLSRCKHNLHKAYSITNAFINDLELTKPSGGAIRLDKGVTRKGKSSAQKTKKPKSDTKLISYQLYKSGLSVEKIAEEREMTKGTITGHLFHYVKLGELAVSEVVDLERFSRLQEELKTKSGMKLSEIKKEVGSEYTYDEIKLGLLLKE